MENHDVKKVALVTCYLNNFGACLQAYAMQNKINELCGQENACEILQYEATEVEVYKNAYHRLYPIPFYTAKAFLSKCKHAVLSRKKPWYEQSLVNRLMDTSDNKFCKFRKKYLNFSSKLYSLEDFYSTQFDFDAYVSGSDQLWNMVFSKNVILYIF